jgi:hypothetical protein
MLPPSRERGDLPPPFRFLAGNAAAFLQFADEVSAVAVGDGQVVVGELSPFHLELAGELPPLPLILSSFTTALSVMGTDRPAPWRRAGWNQARRRRTRRTREGFIKGTGTLGPVPPVA